MAWPRVGCSEVCSAETMSKVCFASASRGLLAALGGIKKKYGGANESTGILVGAVDNAVARK